MLLRAMAEAVAADALVPLPFEESDPTSIPVLLILVEVWGAVAAGPSAAVRVQGSYLVVAADPTAEGGGVHRTRCMTPGL